MRILLHDFGGYAFCAQLGRALATRGHAVRYVYCRSLQTTPRGLGDAREPAAGMDVRGIELADPIDKYDFVKRWRQEREYGRLAAREVGDFRPDVVLSANAPLDAQRRLMRACRRRGVRFVFWLQDLLGVAADRLLRQKVPVAGRLVGRYYVALERRLLRASEAVVLITDDFRPVMRVYGVADAAVRVVENWAPLEDVPLRPRDNDWARAQGLDGGVNLLYSGSMGMKHNPELLLRLALRLRGREGARVVVVSRGLGADWLRARKAEHGLENLVVMDFQPFEALPDVLASADVLVAVLEPAAGAFSVPSKVLTYLCAGRPVLLAVPPENLAARIVERSGAGRVVPPIDVEAFVDAAEALVDDPDRRRALGQNARSYAEAAFDIEAIATAFEDLLEA